MSEFTTHIVAFPPLLDVPAPAYMPGYIEALKEGFVRGSELPMSEPEIEAIEEDPARYLDRLLGPQPLTVILPDGSEVPRVPETHLWLVEGSRFIGAVSIRHRLTPHLENMGGHIGYGIRPGERGKGYGRMILKLAIRYCRDNLGLGEILLTCDETNQGSRRVIEHNGGELIDRHPHLYKKDAFTLRYRIPA